MIANQEHRQEEALDWNILVAVAGDVNNQN